METNFQNELRQKSLICCLFSRRNLCDWWFWRMLLHVIGLEILVVEWPVGLNQPNERSSMHAFISIHLRNAINICFRRFWLFAIKFSVKIQFNKQSMGDNKWNAVSPFHALFDFGSWMIINILSVLFVNDKDCRFISILIRILTY